jgi:hypothetical protein
LEAPLPGGYYREPVVTALIDALEQGIVTGEGDAVPLLQTLGARFILLRRDLVTDFPGRHFRSPRLLGERLEHTPGVVRVRSLGLVDIYEARHLRDPEAHAALPTRAVGADVAAVREAVPEAGANTALVQPAAWPELRGLRAGAVRIVQATRGGERLDASLRRRALIVRLIRRRARHAPVTVRVLAVRLPYPPFRVFLGRDRFVVRHVLRKPRLIGVRELRARHGLLPARAIDLRPELARGVGDCYKRDPRTLNEVGIAADVERVDAASTLRLRARDHSACVVLPIGGIRGQAPFGLGLSYRGVRGNPPRVCVWQVGPDRCATLPPLAGSHGWHRLATTVTPEPGTRSLRLFLYADGSGGGRGVTETEYRRIFVAQPAPALGVAVAPVARLPELSYRRVGPTVFRIRVRGARTPFLLVVAETFDPGWELRASGRNSANAAHFRVDGYANGWRIPWTGSYELTVRYGPERLAQLARRIDLVGVPLGLVALLWSLCRRGRRRA